MLKDFYIVRKWKELTRKEKKFFFLGMFMSMLIMAPVILIDSDIPTPTLYTARVIENQIDYNNLYTKYCGEVGNATEYDSAIILVPALDGSIYKNIEITITTGAYLRAICFIDLDDNVIEKINSPQSGETYMIEHTDEIGYVIVFLYSIAPIYTIELWVW